MAVKQTTGTKTEKKVAKSSGNSFGSKTKSFFKGIMAELRKVIWPDKKHLKQNTAAVLLIFIISAVMIFVFDWLVSTLMSTTGFYNLKETAATETKAPVAVEDQAVPSESTDAAETEAPTEPAETTAEQN